jgi:muramoyltetrapeptide carboxypeptidase
MKTIVPPLLKQGDKVALVAPARKISAEELQFTLRSLESLGYVPVTGQHLFGQSNQFSGTDQERAADMQAALNDPEVKAIFCARGGYGCMRMVDLVDWSVLRNQPKWLIGFSDTTVLLQHCLQRANVVGIHAEMPINFEKHTNAYNLLMQSLHTGQVSYNVKSNNTVRPVNCSGQLVGGNLSLLYALQGSSSEPDYSGKILFIEDLDEYLYHIDRMLLSLKRAGKFKALKGVVIGGFTQMKDNVVPFGNNAEAIIRSVFSEYDYPLFFDFPAGHIEENYPIAIGLEAVITVTNDGYTFQQHLK